VTTFVRTHLRREMLMLLAMWGVGALLLVSAIHLSGESDNARQRQIVVGTMREDTLSAPWIAFNGTGAAPLAVDRQIAGLARSLNDSIVRLRELGDTRSSTPIARRIPAALQAIHTIRSQSRAHRLDLAIREVDRSIAPKGAGGLLWTSLTRADAAYQEQGERAASRARWISILLTLVILIALSAALSRSLSARRRAETLTRDKQRLLEHSQAEATTDALTGMGNRRALFDEADRQLRDLPAGRNLSLGIYDLDGFKSYNDNFGHPAGDALLAHLGRQLMVAVADRGTAYRMGGDEFCVLTTHANADRVHQAAALALSEHGERFSIGCSYGICAIPDEAPSLEQALQIADRRLYAHKESTRSSQSVQIKDALLQVLAEQSDELVTHLGRVAALSVATATRLELPLDEVGRIRLAAELHDVGKAAVPRVILDKPGPLDAIELAYLRQHSVIGERILAAAPALANVAPLVRATHERPDGTGYPDGLRLAQIPLGSRVIAVVDAYDAMTTARPYQTTRGSEQALAELRRGAGTQFDPAVVAAFIAVIGEREERHWRALRLDGEKADALAGSSNSALRTRSGRRAHRN
jgi:diguanylate cyclase (GGDEF)-like protein